MTVAMCAYILFSANDIRKSFAMRRINSVEIESSWRMLTDTATITLPRNVMEFDRSKVRDVFKRGDAVTIYLGYNDRMYSEFSGYISQVSADIPIELKCEDEMFMIKKIPVNFSSVDISLDVLLKSIIKGYEIDALEGCELGKVRFTKTNVGAVLEKLQSEFKIYTYIEPGTKKIVSGKIYADNSDEQAYMFDLDRNIVSNDLVYRNKDDVRVKVTGTAIKSGEKLEYSFGDEDADKNIDWQFLVSTQKDLEEAVKRMYDANKSDGFDGSFTGFGVPSVLHGRKARLVSTRYPDRDGVYYIEGVNKSFDTGGYRQQIKIGNLYERRN